MKWLVTAVVLALGLAAYLYLFPASNSEVETPKMNTYSDANFGVSFTYPDTYVLSETDTQSSQDASGRIATIVLVDKVAAANIPEAGEGPTSITFDIYVANPLFTSLDAWIRGSQQSNFQLSRDSVISPASIAGIEALSYTWDGLYMGRSVALPHGEEILVASVTSLTPNDVILSDFEAILATLVLK